MSLYSHTYSTSNWGPFLVTQELAIQLLYDRAFFFPLLSTFWPHNYFSVTVKGWRREEKSFSNPFLYFPVPHNNLTQYVGEESALESG